MPLFSSRWWYFIVNCYVCFVRMLNFAEKVKYGIDIKGVHQIYCDIIINCHIMGIHCLFVSNEVCQNISAKIPEMFYFCRYATTNRTIRQNRFFFGDIFMWAYNMNCNAKILIAFIVTLMSQIKRSSYVI